SYSTCKRVVELEPNSVSAYSNLGITLMELNRVSEAIENFTKALSLKPNYAEGYNNLGIALQDLKELDDAVKNYKKAIAIEPNYAQAYYNLGNALRDLGRLDEAVSNYNKAIAIVPDYSEAYDNLLFCLHYIDSFPVEKALETAKRYGTMISLKAEPKFSAWHKSEKSDKLRIGFVSADLINHSVGFFVEGLFRHLDKKQFELFAFPTLLVSDSLTSRIRPFFQEWLPIYNKNDLDAATLIHEKGIDILIDLSGHTAHNRLPVFAYKPAPIQLTWLGYSATSGLKEMDYILGDSYVTPTNEHYHFSENILTLEQTYICFTPPTQSVTIGSPPLLKNGYVTFGSFNNLTKMHEEVVRVWATILKETPNSKLFLKNKQFSNKKIIKKVENQFFQYGISNNRLTLQDEYLSRTEHLKAYNRIDIALDTFAYTGVTTSAEALWMGVPVLTLQGDRFMSHIGESIMHNTKQSNWIAKDKEDYIKKAVAFASNKADLVNIRSTLRDKVLKTPLYNTKLFAKNFEKVLLNLVD
ncbi:MAG: tetratricopeptide repeat protein, partial [Campylobacterota bacterium]|nr:tetratricopeptide repeat protein [Campylobacterota bacterium]